MGYVNISDYKEALTNPAGFFSTLKEVEVKRDKHGGISYIAGSNSVVFDVMVSGARYAMKCYTSINEKRDSAYEMIARAVNGNRKGYLAGFRYFKDEILVYDSRDTPLFYPVLLMEKAHGKTLGRWLEERCDDKDRQALNEAAVRFDKMALWLLSESFAHGDLKQDNIIVAPDGRLRLIDLDGMFTPEMEGFQAPELGTPNFQHPRRDRKFFNKHIDDYPLALISISLHALADYPELYMERNDGENLIFYPHELVEGTSPLLHKLKDRWICEGKNTLYFLLSTLSSKSPVIGGLKEVFAKLTGEAHDTAYEKLGQNEGMEIIRKDGFYGFRDTETGQEIPPVYDDVKHFSERVAAVRIMKRWFYIDGCGRKVIDASAFDEAGMFAEGFAVVGKKGRYGYMDRSGSIAIALEYEDARDFREGLAGVKRGGKYGFIDRTGEYVIAPEYEFTGDFKEGVAIVGIDGKFGYIDKSGKRLLEPVFDFASGFRNGIAAAEQGDKRYKVEKTCNGIIYEEWI